MPHFFGIDKMWKQFFPFVRSFIRCVIISKCCQNMPILPTSLVTIPLTTHHHHQHIALSRHLSCHRYHRQCAFFSKIISGTCLYIRFSFQNQCIVSFEAASFYNIIVKLYASRQQNIFTVTEKKQANGANEIDRKEKMT